MSDKDPWSDLRPHIINLSRGKFSQTGLYSNTREQVSKIFDTHLVEYIDECRTTGKTPRILLYAHGGLVDERTGLNAAREAIPIWRANDCYPIYIVWETGWWESLKRRWLGTPEDQEIVAETAFGIKEQINDWAAERIARLAGRQLWDEMKDSAAKSVTTGGGGTLLLQMLTETLRAKEDGGAIELHAIGHSAGAILHAYLLPAYLTQAGDTPVSVSTMTFLAPAITVANFETQLVPLLGKPKGGIEHMVIFAMHDQQEREDTCPAGNFVFYMKSLLYLIYNSLEEQPRTPILGLEISLRSASLMTRQILGLVESPNTSGEVIFSPTTMHEGRNASCSLAHGGFDRDGPTMNSILRRITNLPDSATLAVSFPDGKMHPSHLEVTETIKAPFGLPGSFNIPFLPQIEEGIKPPAPHGSDTVIAPPSHEKPKARVAATAALLRSMADFIESETGASE